LATALDGLPLAGGDGLLINIGGASPAAESIAAEHPDVWSGIGLVRGGAGTALSAVTAKSPIA